MEAKVLPSDDLSKAIANVCGENYMLLVIEAYVDNAPDEIKTFINLSRKSIFEGIVLMYKNKFPEDTYNLMKNEIDKMELSQFILDMNNALGDFDITSLPNDFEIAPNKNFTQSAVTFKKPIGLEMKDDSMFPIIPKGATVLLEYQEAYKNGDILCLQRKSNPDKLVFRKCFLSDKEIMLCPINNTYKTETFSINEITILGKVSSFSLDL